MEEKLMDEVEELMVEFDEMGFEPTTLRPDFKGYAEGYKKRILRLFERFQGANEKILEITREKSKDYYAAVRSCVVKDAEISELKGEIAEFQKQVDDVEERLSAKQNELWNLQDDFDNLLAEGVRNAAQELLQDLFYFLDGNSFWLKETGDKVHYVKLDDALAFMRKKAKQYFVEVEE